VNYYFGEKLGRSNDEEAADCLAYLHLLADRLRALT